MLRRLTLSDFKSFREATVPFGPFTLLIGANAGGKSNVRDALRFLHGVARGYSLAEALGEKWGPGGELEWTGIRGGARHAARRGTEEFTVAVDLEVDGDTDGGVVPARYEITVGIRDGGIPLLSRERLTVGRCGFDTHPDGHARPGGTDRTIPARLRKGVTGAPPDEVFVRDRPILGQLGGVDMPAEMARLVTRVVGVLETFRFLDLDPDLARRSSPRGITTLGDRGQNLSSVLAHFAADADVRESVSGWIRALTPMDAVDVEFETDLDNRTLAVLVEESGERTPLTSASDGTIRFLAVVALLFLPDPPSLFFLEEIENGIHPHRISLLLELLDQRVQAGDTQIVATSHSPRLLEGTWEDHRARPVLLTRTRDRGSVAVDVRNEPGLADVLADPGGAAGAPADLMADGWFEDAAAFLLAGDD